MHMLAMTLLLSNKFFEDIKNISEQLQFDFNRRMQKVNIFKGMAYVSLSFKSDKYW